MKKYFIIFMFLMFSFIPCSFASGFDLPAKVFRYRPYNTTSFTQADIPTSSTSNFVDLTNSSGFNGYGFTYVFYNGRTGISLKAGDELKFDQMFDFQYLSNNINDSFSIGQSGFIFIGSSSFSCDVTSNHYNLSTNYYYSAQSAIGGGSGNSFTTHFIKPFTRVNLHYTCYIDKDVSFNVGTNGIYTNSPLFSQPNFTTVRFVNNYGSYFGYSSSLQSSIDNLNESQKETNKTLKDSDVSTSSSSASSFFNGFSSSDYGLADVIKLPLNFINNLSSGSCSSITLPLPFVANDVVLPCISTIMNKHFSSFVSVYQVITFGIISYFICLDIFKIVRGFKNPDSDNIEVLEL